jgi:RHS repeat-associated protein
VTGRFRSSSFLLAFVLIFVAPAVYAQCEEQPSVSVSFLHMNPITGAISTRFSHNHPDSIAYTWRGETTTPVPSSTDPTFEVVLMGYCQSQGETLHVVATKCGKTQSWDFSFGPPDTKPQLTPKVFVGKGWGQVNVEFLFPAGNAREPLRAILFGSTGTNGVVFQENVVSQAGSRTVYSGSDGGVVLIEAVSCTNIHTATAVPVPKGKTDCKDCAPCQGCVGHPVHTLSGNMQYEDVDAIPGFDALPFRRVYDSATSYDGHFGHRWSSIFGAKISTADALESGVQYVNMRTERGEQFIFRGTGGTYTQIHPTGGAPTILQRAADGTWTHRDFGGSRTRLYSADGKPIAFRDLTTGREVRLGWVQGRPVAVTDSWGAWSLTLTTDAASGRITAIAVDGQPSLVWTYVYEENRLVRVDSPVGTWRSYTYEFHPTGNFWYPMSVIRDGQGRLIESHTYAERDIASNSLSDSGDITSIVIAEAGRVPDEVKTVVTYRTGRVELHYRRFIANDYRTVEIDGGCSSCGGRNQVLAYDEKGNPIRVQDGDGYVVETTFDTLARVTQRRTALRPSNCDPATASVHCRQAPEALVSVALIPTDATTITTYQYNDPLWPDRVTVTTTGSVRNPSGFRIDTTTFHPATGAVATVSTKGWTGDPLREETRTSSTVFYGASDAASFTPGGNWNAAWTSLPQPYGLPRMIDGPRTDIADVTTFVYYPIDSNVPPALRGRLAATRNAAGHVSLYEDYDLHGNPRRNIDPNGVVRILQYDALGRLTSSTLQGVTGCDTAADPLCATPLTSTRTFNGTSAVMTEERPGGGITMYDYDALRRVASISRSTAVANEMTERVSYTYDPLTGQKSSEVIAGRSGASWLEKKRASYAYDTLGQLRELTHADDALVQYTYDAEGRIATLRDENHTAPNTFYTYDAAGRLREVRQVLASGFVTTRYAYDLHGNLTSVTDPNGNVTTYVYDDFGQMLSQMSPVTGTTTYTYDLAGQLIGTTDANGATTTRTYDSLGRVLSSTSAKASASEAVTWTYDTSAFGIGAVAMMTDPTGGTTYAYERRGLLIREQKSIGAATYVTLYRYDRDGNRSRITYPSGRVVDYAHDLAGRPTAASTNGTPLVTATTYLPFGPRTELVLGNGTRQSTTYDSRYRPDVDSLIGPNGTLASYDYAHDAAGNVTQIHDQLDPAYNRNFGYDDLNHLTTANTGAALWGTGSYTYDAMGNMQTAQLGVTSTVFSYRGSTSKLLQVDESGSLRMVTYDAAGNATLAGNRASQYGPRNVLSGTGNVGFSYDGRGIRTIKAYPPPPIASLTIDQTPVYTHQTVLATITLSEPAPAGGAEIGLSASSAQIAVPSSVTIAAGALTATFPVTAAPGDVDSTVTVVASYAGTTAHVAVHVTPGPTLTSMTIAPSTIVGGETATITLQLAAPAPIGGAPVRLSVPQGVTAPETITIAAGDASASATIQSSVVTSVANLTIAARYTTVVSTTLTVRPIELDGVTVNPATVMAGRSASGVVTLTGIAPSGGITVSLTSGNAAVAVVPATIVVPAGQRSASFPISTSAQSAAAPVAITAAYGGVTRSATLQVTPCVSARAPQGSVPGDDVVWIDDSLPAGAFLELSNRFMLWDDGQSAAGTRSLTLESYGTGVRDAYVSGLDQPLHYGEKLTGYLLVDECQPPREIKIAYTTNLGNVEIFWGERLLGGETWWVDMGPVPAGGSWVRFEVPILPNSQHTRLTRIRITYYDGRAWFDRIGKFGAACIPATGANVTPAGGETVFFDDALPPGAVLQQSLRGPLRWTTEQHATGSQALSNSWKGNGAYEAYVNSLAEPVHMGERLFGYFLVNECVPPREVSIHWQTNKGLRGLYWGEALIGSEGTYMGPVPPGGTWVKAELPPHPVTEQATLVRVWLKHYNGQVFFDRFGKEGTPCIAATAAPASIPAGDRLFVDDSLPAGATLGTGPNGPLQWDTTQAASGGRSLVHRWSGAVLYETYINGLNLRLSAGERLALYMRPNECAPPREVKLTFIGTNGTFKTAYWGEPLIGSDGVHLGPIPLPGSWHRMEIPLASLGLELKTLTRIGVHHYGGQVWLDAFAEFGEGCEAAVISAPQMPAADRVFADDQVPLAFPHAFRWSTDQPASGTHALVNEYLGTGQKHLGVMNVSQLLNAGDVIAFYLRVNECVSPREINLRWCTTAGCRVSYFGEALTGNEGGGVDLGAVPAGGAWHRVEVPVNTLGLAGRTLSSVEITTWGGQVWLDHFAISASLAPAILTGFTASHPSPHAAGTTITWTATATGSVMPLEYRFERLDNGSWAVVQAYGASNTYAWTPTASDAGDHAVRVSVRNAGSVADFDDYDILPVTITVLEAHTSASGGFRRAVTEDGVPVTLGVSFGRLTSSSASQPQRYSFYTPELQLMAETTITTATTPPVEYEYIWFGGQPLAQVDGAGNLSWYTNDHLGTPILQTNNTAQIVWRAEYEPYGTVHAFRAGATKHQPLRFPGQESDPETQLAYNVFRWYRAGWGRYTQSDPLGIEGGINLFQYVASNPLRYADPFGLAYFAKRPLENLIWFPLLSCNPFYAAVDAEPSHEQLFFTDGKSPSNVGFFSDGTLKTEHPALGYRCPSVNYNDCVMREAVKQVGTPGPYCLLGFGPNAKNNCQDWATLVKKKYSELINDPQIQQQCKCTPTKKWWEFWK